MSGGSFDYAYGRVSAFADELAHKLAEADDDTVRPAIRRRMEATVKHAEWLAKQMRATEWFFSGDHGDKAYFRESSEPPPEVPVTVWEQPR